VERQVMLDNFLRKPSLSFKARSPARDHELVRKLVGRVETALHQAEREIAAQRDGLQKRLDAIVTRAAVIGGNDIDDSLTRDVADAAVLAASDVEIARAESRLKTLEEQLSHLAFLQDALHARFPMSKTRLLIGG
jgi:hypothetical protein